jgi:hypothetical protein
MSTAVANASLLPTTTPEFSELHLIYYYYIFIYYYEDFDVALSPCRHRCSIRAAATTLLPLCCAPPTCFTLLPPPLSLLPPPCCRHAAASLRWCAAATADFTLLRCRHRL